MQGAHTAGARCEHSVWVELSKDFSLRCRGWLWQALSKHRHHSNINAYLWLQCRKDSSRQDCQFDLNSQDIFQKVSRRAISSFSPLYHPWSIFLSFSDHQQSVAGSQSKFPSWAVSAANNVNCAWGKSPVTAYQAVKQVRKLPQFGVTMPKAKEVYIGEITFHFACVRQKDQKLVVVSENIEVCSF